MIQNKYLNYYILFFIYSIFGWIFEVSMAYFYFDIGFINKGFLYGPYLPIYGTTCLLIIILFSKYKNKNYSFPQKYTTPLLFIKIQLLVCSIEFITSYTLEKLFNKRWWNYTFKYNIQGRICLIAALLFGFLGLIVLYFINPFLEKQLNKLSNKTKRKITLLIIIVFLTDFIASIYRY